MKNTSYFKNLALGLYLASSFSTMAQKTIVTDTKTDQTYANTTQVFKSEKATDSQVLAEIDGNFGIGDVVRIAVAPPPVKTVPPPPPATPKPSVNGKSPNIAVVATPTQQGTTTINTPSNAAPNIVKAAEPQRVTTPPQQKRTIVYIPLETKPNVVKAAEPQRVTTPAQQGTTAVNTPTNATPNVVKTTEPQGVTTPSEQKVTMTNIETPPSVNEANRVDKNTERASTLNSEKQIERRSTRSEKAGSRVKKSSSKSKSSFSLFSNWGFKSTKSSKFKGGSKFGCYRF